MRKNAYGLFLMCFLLSAQSALAVGYEPLVHIPGLPEGGVVDISAYLVGIYNFLLSIVGILAVIMLIIGGMKYITAAGNSGAVTDAKDTIWNALFGLALALLSWVIVGTINPDVLYLRQPGAALSETDLTVTSPINRCYASYGGGTCTCNNGYSAAAATERVCQIICKLDNRCVTLDPNFCIAPGSSLGPNDPMAYDGYCSCKVGGRIPMPAGMTNCQEACLAAKKCGHKFLAVKVNASFEYAAEGDDGESKYLLNAARGDALWELEKTNDPNWGDFDINGESYTDDAGNEFVCALLVTNEQNNAIDDHWIFWVREGVKVGDDDTLWNDINPNFYSDCSGMTGTNEFSLSFGDCDQPSVERVMKAVYSDDVVDNCQSCSLADGIPGSKAFQFNRAYTCRGGYWQ